MENDELVAAQWQIIGILFEIVKLQQTNSDLDMEYFQILTKDKMEKPRLEKIITEKRQNSETIGRLLKQLET